jgi:two-component system sensor histidine kinase KdpD
MVWAIAAPFCICQIGGVKIALPFPLAAHRQRPALGLACTALFSALGVWLAPYLGEGYAALVFVVGVSVVGALCGLSVALAMALLGALAFDFFVSEPVFKLSLRRVTDLAPLVVFTLSALISGLLSGRLRDEAMRANASNLHLQNLLDIARRLQRANSAEQVYQALQEGLADTWGEGQRLGLFREQGGQLVELGSMLDDPQAPIMAREVASGPSEVLRIGDMVACRLASGEGSTGALVVQGDGLDAGFLLAKGRLAALALERVALARQLAEAHAHARAEDLKTALLSSVSHDLRSPLTAISTSAASLLEFGASFDAETSRELLAGIVDEAARLNDVTTNLLQMTRLQDGGANLLQTPLSVGETLLSVVARKRRGGVAQRLVLDGAEDDLVIMGDRVLFDLAITNILHNAMLYSPADSTITIACARHAQGCQITVTDEGQGIPAAEQALVFDRFYRGANNARQARGSGLGLSIARGFVEACGGRIEITSPIAQGKGTCLAIILPLMVSQDLHEDAFMSKEAP